MIFRPAALGAVSAADTRQAAGSPAGEAFRAAAVRLGAAAARADFKMYR